MVKVPDPLPQKPSQGGRVAKQEREFDSFGNARSRSKDVSQTPAASFKKPVRANAGAKIG